MIELIPAIDLIDGKCVRLSQGEYDSKKIYNEDPLEVARQIEGHGIRRLHLVDLDGAASNHVVNYRTLEQIVTHTSLVIDFGGGIKTDEDLSIAFNCGARMVTVGSVAVKQPELFTRWLHVYGADRIILGADVKGGRIAVDGWLHESENFLLPFLDHYISQGVRQVVCTDVSRDGMLQGPAVSLYKEVMERHPDLYLIASGGVSCLKDIQELSDAGIPAVIFGKALYEGRITFRDLELLSQ